MEGGDPSPAASPPSPPMPTSAPPRLPAPLVLHAYLLPRAVAVDAPRTILLPCHVAAAPRFPLTIFAPRLDSRPIGELRSQQHIGHSLVACTGSTVIPSPQPTIVAAFRYVIGALVSPAPLLLLFSPCGRRTPRPFLFKASRTRSFLVFVCVVSCRVSHCMIYIKKNYSFVTGRYSLLKCTIGVIFVYPCAAYHELGFCGLGSSYQLMRSTEEYFIPKNADNHTYRCF